MCMDHIICLPLMLHLLPVRNGSTHSETKTSTNILLRPQAKMHCHMFQTLARCSVGLWAEGTGSCHAKTYITLVSVSVFVFLYAKNIVCFAGKRKDLLYSLIRYETS